MSSSSKTDVAMKGGGYYSLATVGAGHVIDAATPMVLSAIEQVLSRDPVNSRFTISDMGAADGGTSLGMMRAAIRHLRGIDENRDVHIVYTDQPRNDYNALFQIVLGETDFDAYVDAFPNVFISAAATTFYQQILPRNSLQLGFSATAMHWLSQKPGNISDHVHMVGAQGEELQTFARQAAGDWQKNLLHRAAELAPGGRLVLVNFGRDERGRYLGNTEGINMFDTFNEIWLSFVDSGAITRDEYVSMTMPQYYNTVEEFSAPFLTPGSPVRAAGLELVDISTGVVACPFADTFGEHGDAEKFAREYIPTLRSWTEATFYDALDEARPQQQRRELIDGFYGEYQARVAANPEGHRMDYVHAYMTIAKST